MAGGIALIAGSGGAAGVSAAELHCVSINDAQSLDTQLAAAGSPLAGNGAVFVREGIANNIDPRFIVAITAQETMLETYGPAQEIHNAFGLGPGISFASEADAITMAAQTLHRYTQDGLTTIGAVSSRPSISRVFQKTQCRLRSLRSDSAPDPAVSSARLTE